MSVDTFVAPRALAAPASSRRRHDHASGSTSIRVTPQTRDVLARQAESAGLSLGAYLETVARRVEREQVFAEFRASEAEALRDPSYVAELMEWEQMEDDVEFADE